jgi:DNA-binding winged helix-turn-helix (wHTH) protein
MTRIRLEGFLLDVEGRQLLRDGQPVHLAPKALELLELLLDRRPNAVSKSTIHARLWPETFVAEVNLAVLVHRVREALGDDPRDPRYVRTVIRYGYAFCGPAWVEGDGSGGSAEFEYRVVVGAKDVVLRAGENLLGRAHDAAVRVDQTSVSRRHATIAVTKEGATIADCASKNGTFVGSRRVSSPTALRDGDRILLGAALLVFRCFRHDPARGSDPASRPTSPLPPGGRQRPS